jgi:DNA-directed RNA polymerase subunit RPC12/RpoP
MGSVESMSEKESTHGLACPNCGGMVSIPEGQLIVRCPYCEMRSLVKGERGLTRYQVPLSIKREKALPALKRFLSQHRAIASDAIRTVTLQEAFPVFLPFWTSWAHVLGWVFGQKRVGSGDDARYEPREVQVDQDATWNGAACDVGEFGVQAVTVEGRPLEVFEPETLHNQGLVFEPVGSASQARATAEETFNNLVSRAARLDRVAQAFVRFVRTRFGLVYYPLWVLRYLYRGRTYQVTLDGYSGEVLYGKAPGNTLYRAAMLVGGMALGAFLAVDGSALVFYMMANSDGDSGGLFVFALGLLVAGFGVMGVAYRKFRRGEEFEFRRSDKSLMAELFQPMQLFSQGKDLETWINRLS